MNEAQVDKYIEGLWWVELIGGFIPLLVVLGFFIYSFRQTNRMIALQLAALEEQRAHNLIIRQLLGKHSDQPSESD